MQVPGHKFTFILIERLNTRNDSYLLLVVSLARRPSSSVLSLIIIYFLYKSDSQLISRPLTLTWEKTFDDRHRHRRHFRFIYRFLLLLLLLLLGSFYAYVCVCALFPLSSLFYSIWFYYYSFLWHLFHFNSLLFAGPGKTKTKTMARRGRNRRRRRRRRREEKKRGYKPGGLLLTAGVFVTFSRVNEWRRFYVLFLSFIYIYIHINVYLYTHTHTHIYITKSPSK